MAWKLPQPDQWGNYWLATHNGENKVKGPAVFPSKRLKVNDDGTTTTLRNGTYIAWTGERFLFEGADFSRFKTARAALEAINERGRT